MPTTIDLPQTGRRSAVGAITVAESEQRVFGVAVTGQRATTGGLIVPQSVSTPGSRNDPAVTVDLYDNNDETLIGPVARSNAREWQESASDLGSASVSVPAGSAAERVAANALAPGRHLRFKYRGRTAYSARIEVNETTRIDADHSAQRATVSAVDKRVVLDRHTIRPDWPESEAVDSSTRTFGWMSRELSDAGWKNAVAVQPTVALAWQLPNTDPPFFQPWEPPRGWATINTPIMQPRSGIVMPAGTWAARRRLITPGIFPGWYLFQLASIGRTEMFLNSTKVAETGEGPQSWLTPLEVMVPLTASVEIGLLVTKDDLPVNVGLPGTFANFNRRSLVAMSVHHLPDGPGTTPEDGFRTITSGASWKVLDYPTRFPAPTVGRILRALVTEADGLPSNFELGFSDTNDSAGRLWPLNDETTFRDSDTIWDALVQLRAKGYESRMSNVGYRLDVFGPPPFTGATPIRVQSARQTQRPTLPNRLKVQWARGRFTVSRFAAERVEAKLNLGEVRSEQEARAIAEAELSRNELRADRWDVTPTLYADDGLYLSWRARDWVKVVGEDENVDLRVESVTVSEDADLNVSGRLELTSPLEFLEESFQRRLERMAAGAIGNSASPVRWLDPNVQVGFVQQENIPEFSQSSIVLFPEEGGESTAHTFDIPTRISLIRFTAISNPVSPGIFVRLRKNNTNLEPILWLSPGSSHAVYLPSYLVFLPGDRLQARMIDAGEGAGLVSVSFHAAIAAPGAVRPERPFGWL